jgi:hypothetical protein
MKTLLMVLCGTLAFGQLALGQPNQSLGGIGGHLTWTNGSLSIAHLTQDMPGALAGLRVGERIVAIDGKPTAGMSFTQAVALIRGKVPTKVQLTVVDAKEVKRKVSVVRAWPTFQLFEDNWRIDFKNFQTQAKMWGSLDGKNELPSETERQRVLAENAVKEERYTDALQHYRNGLMACTNLWPEGLFNAATLCGEDADLRLKQSSTTNQSYAAMKYRIAAEYMERYLELLPQAPDATVAKEKMIVWDEKCRALKRTLGASLQRISLF